MIKKLPEEERRLLLDKLDQIDICESTVTFNEEIPSWLFKTKEQYLTVKGVIKNYLKLFWETKDSEHGKEMVMECNIHDVHEPKQYHKEFVENLQLKWDDMSTKCNQQDSSIKELQETFLSDLKATVDAVITAQQKSALSDDEDRDEDEMDLGKLEEEIQILISTFQQKGLELNDPLLLIVCNYLLTLGRAHFDIVERVATSVFKSCDAPSLDLTLIFTHRWLNKIINAIFLDSFSILLPLSFLVRKLDRSTFEALLEQINIEFIASAILKQEKLYTTTSIPVYICLLSYADQLAEQFASALKEEMTKWRRTH